ncbi:YveK family protein [Enterocloster citroniae]
MENNIYEDRNENEIEIDVLELLFVFKKKAWVIILAALAGCLGSGIYSKMILKPVYTSTSMVYVLSKETTLTSLADLQIGSQLTKDYSVMITSRPVLEQVIENQGLNLSYTQLKNMIRISNPADTRILNMSVSDTDPVRAKAIVDAVAKASSDYIGDIMEMIPPKIIENGVVPSVPTSPNIKKNAALGGLAMIVAACGIISLQVIMNDTIRSEEDVSRYLGISVLAAIPANGEAENNPLVQKNKRKKSRKKQKPISKKG